MEQKDSWSVQLFYWIAIALIYAFLLFLGYLAFKYFWPNKFNPNNFWYQEFDPEVFCQNYLKGTQDYLDCQETAYRLAEKQATRSY